MLARFLTPLRFAAWTRLTALTAPGACPALAVIVPFDSGAVSVLLQEGTRDEEKRPRSHERGNASSQRPHTPDTLCACSPRCKEAPARSEEQQWILLGEAGAKNGAWKCAEHAAPGTLTHSCLPTSQTSLATARAASGEKRLRRLLTRCQEWANPESRRATVRPASHPPTQTYLTRRIYPPQAELLDSDAVMGPVAAVLRGDANVGELRKARGRPPWPWRSALPASRLSPPRPAHVCPPCLGATDAHDRPGTHVAVQERHLVRCASCRRHSA